jgi:hypothetical protein
MARDYIKIMGRWGDGEIGRNRRQKAVDKKRTRNTDTIRRFENAPRVNFLYRKVWGQKSEVQCLNCIFTL